MLIEVRAKNCFAFSDEVIFSMKADMRNKKFAPNVYNENYFNVLKVAGIYGPNNSGKTCLIKCIRSIRNILMHTDPMLMPNIFKSNSLSELGITFLEKGRKFSYDLKYDTSKKEYPYEKFVEHIKDKYGNEKENIWLIKDNTNSKFKFVDSELEKLIPIIAQNNILCYLIDVEKFPMLAEMKNILTNFASKIDVINMNNIPMQRTINLMKNKSHLQEKVVNFIKNADLYMDNFKYVKMDEIKVKTGDEKPEEKVLEAAEQLMEQICLVSVYKGIEVPSMLFDSTGTKKIAALASYIIEGLEQGRILVVDELDSSIHFKLARAIVSMFNNELNINSQLIFSVHDINLMDCKKLFRKEQIWFVHKDEERVYLYSLADFTAEKGVRDTTDIIEKYRKGLLGAIPEPELIKSLVDINVVTKGE